MDDTYVAFISGDRLEQTNYFYVLPKLVMDGMVNKYIDSLNIGFIANPNLQMTDFLTFDIRFQRQGGDSFLMTKNIQFFKRIQLDVLSFTITILILCFILTLFRGIEKYKEI